MKFLLQTILFLALGSGLFACQRNWQIAPSTSVTSSNLDSSPKIYQLRTQQGLEISLSYSAKVDVANYSSNKPLVFYFADQVRLIVKGSLKSTDRLEARLIGRYREKFQCGIPNPAVDHVATHQLELTWDAASNSFVGQLPVRSDALLVGRYGYCQHFEFRDHEFTLVRNGVAEVDAETQSPIFLIRFGLKAE